MSAPEPLEEDLDALIQDMTTRCEMTGGQGGCENCRAAAVALRFLRDSVKRSDAFIALIEAMIRQNDEEALRMAMKPPPARSESESESK